MVPFTFEFQQMKLFTTDFMSDSPNQQIYIMIERSFEKLNLSLIIFFILNNLSLRRTDKKKQSKETHKNIFGLSSQWLCQIIL